MVTINSFRFGTPEKLSEFNPQYRAGMYAILTKNRLGNWKVLYIGETSNYSERGFPTHHHDYPCWKRNSTNGIIYIAIKTMPNSTKKERLELEEKILKGFKTSCNNK